jgi:phenylpyruvate tautomerase PptA (4-oxalocrotonate tautomerase family)
MPSVLIEVRRGYTPEQETALMDAVHLALREAFKIPAHDRNIRLIAHEPHRLQCSPDRAQPELYTHISIDCFAGRSLNAKRALYQAIVGKFEVLGIPKNHVLILLHEIPKENWGIRGGQAGCDIDLGFQIEI